ncbi:Ccw14p PWA37_002663 [Arxiozyma heterogenica]|uniref:CFEM domain-containing protein n=1 Tax=Arxiozyma heterogenica TaxID=278026 RepID=A0AAN7ZY26_9SACH|nr:hypothetical protein RI543_002132 [Kazachstania heterogenica]
MLSSTVFSAVLSLALLSNEVLATPPACLLACVAQVTKSSSSCNALNDVTCICSNEGASIKSCLDSICPNGNADAAYSAFKSSCAAQNASINQASSSSSVSSTSTSSSISSSSSSSTTTTSSSSVVHSSSTAVETTSSKVTTSSTSTSTSISSTSTTVVSSTLSSSSSSTQRFTVSEIHSGAGNFLQAGNSFVVAAVAALLI